MQLSAKEAWRCILDEAQREVPANIIRNWLEPTKTIALEDEQLIIGAPDQFAAEWNQAKHAPVLSRPRGAVAAAPDGFLRAGTAGFGCGRRLVQREHAAA
jgi:hypothetical protein